MVIYKRRRQITLSASASRRRDGGEIPVNHGLRRHKIDGRGWIRSFPRALVAGEEEQLVLANGPAEYTAELVSLERVARERVGIATIKISISQKLEQIAMNLVGTALCHHIDHSA